MIRTILFTCVMLANTAYGQSLTIKFTNVRSSEGVFRVGFFTDQETYKSGDPNYYITIPKGKFLNGELICNVDSIQPGVYGLVVLDDENCNDKTDFSFFIPTEGFGFSNYKVDRVRIPDFKDFSFLYNNNILVNIELKYL